jgi:hypothetical protein
VGVLVTNHATLEGRRFAERFDQKSVLERKIEEMNKEFAEGVKGMRNEIKNPLSNKRVKGTRVAKNRKGK